MFLALSLLVLVSGCGKMGDPKVPERPIPVNASLSVRQEGSRVLLEMSIESSLVSGVFVFRACGIASPQESDFRLHSRIDRARLLPTGTSGRFYYTLVNPSDRPCHYSVQFETPIGRKSGRSSYATLS